MTTAECCLIRYISLKSTPGHNYLEDCLDFYDAENTQELSEKQLFEYIIDTFWRDYDGIHH